MPPKTRKECREDDELESAGSPATSDASSLSASSAGCMTLSAEQLQLMLDSNTKNMMTFVEAKLTHSTAPTPIPSPKVKIEIPKWKEGDSPSEFLAKYEQALIHNEVDRKEWGRLLRIYLSDSGQEAYHLINPDRLDDYLFVKGELLESLGDTPEGADKRWVTLHRVKGESSRALFRRVHTTGMRRMDGLTSKEECCNRMILSKFLALLSPDCYTSVVAKRPRTGHEAAKFAQEYEEEVQFARSLQPKSSSGYYHSYHKREHHNYSSSGAPSSDRTSGGSHVGSSKPVVVSSTPVVNGGKVEKPRNDKRVPTCYGCGVVGHIRPNCPDKVRRVPSPKPSNFMTVDGFIAGVPVKNLRVDPGADRTVVRAEFVPEDAYTGGSIRLDSWRGSQISVHQLAKVLVKVGKMSVLAEVAVVDVMDSPALLGSDLGRVMTEFLMGCVMESWADKSEEVEQVRLTRAQAAKEKQLEEEDAKVSAESECSPSLLSELPDFPDSYFEEEEVVPTPVDELCMGEGSVVDFPLPNVKDCDVTQLIREQEQDATLVNCMKKGVAKEKGYGFHNQVLVHFTPDPLGDTTMRVVLPVGRRQQVMQLAHCHLAAGHFGFKKSFGKIATHFLWPGMWGDIRSFVKTCALCQKAAVMPNTRVPLHPLPCVDEPFKKIAFDIVGPLPRAHSGNKYILTTMCLFTKFPEAVPLRRVDNTTVLEAMIDIFSRYGIPSEILTDQGSVFTSRLTKQMNKSFGIHHIKTSPYHPQSDGALERWHACLKGMLKKTGLDLGNWDKLLKYLVFAYRDTPHCVTGYSPFALMFGRDVRGPLDFLKSSWVDGGNDDPSVHEWILSVRQKMADMAVIVTDRECKAKTKMKHFYDRSACEKSFVEGDLVLVKNPLKHGKLGPSWSGPFEIQRQVSPVTYDLHLPGSKARSHIWHANMLKKWHVPVDKVCRVVTITDDECEGGAQRGVKLGCEGFVPTAVEQDRLDSVLSLYSHVLTSVPGRTSMAELVIRTGSSQPVRSPFYQIPPRWKEEVKSQIDKLLELGIIRHSTSPWSSSIVLAKKKDGGVRPCIDFRAINAITEPDPYLMPLIEDILAMLATAKFLSKIDLAKGFHQIPISQGDCTKTAFCTPWGKYEFLFMPFGLRNGPAVFQRLMDRVLDLERNFSQVYIDDIVIFSESWEEHCCHISQVLCKLGEAGLTANVSKCAWGQTQIEFLGHMVGQGLVSPAQAKVQAVRDFVMPTTKKGIRQFLGLAGYYRRFIDHFADHTYHLTEATRKLAPERVSSSSDLFDEFMYIKDALCVIPSLTLPVPTDEFLLQTDASGVGLGAVLSVIREKEELPVAFYSRKLLPRERTYSASELEGLAVVSAVDHFQPYLVTHPFIVETDHQALTFLSSAQYRNSRIARWALKLQMYSFSIRYRKGVLHVNADALSRLDSSTPGLSAFPGGGDVMQPPHKSQDSMT